MSRVCGLWWSPNFMERLATEKNFYVMLTVQKMHPFAVFNENIYGHTAVPTPILQLRLCVQIQKLK